MAVKLFSGFAIFVAVFLALMMTQTSIPLIYIVVTFIALALIWRLAIELDKREPVRQATRETYRLNNPSCCIGGLLACSECGVTSLVHPGYREHACKDCGELLYYSRKSRK